MIILAAGSAAGACGAQKIIKIDTSMATSSQVLPGIVDAWTTNDLDNPFNEVYVFKSNVDTLALVTEYSHTGGRIPNQTSVSFIPGTIDVVTNCKYEWTTYLPAGTYLLINYYSSVSVKKTVTLDWAMKVGDSKIGWPDLKNDDRPYKFTIRY